MRIVIVGAGLGGLSAAAVLAGAGAEVVVLEAHAKPGGCAATFAYEGYRFDAGATLPSGFHAGGPMDVLRTEAGIERWPVRPSNRVMDVHLPDGAAVTRWASEERHRVRLDMFGAGAARFWEWQERTAEAVWDLAMRLPSWPPQTLPELVSLAREGMRWGLADPRSRLGPQLAADALRPVSHHLRGAGRRLSVFVDAQLLISSQTTSGRTSALYGAGALDFPRRGAVHAEGGIGAIAETLVQAIRRSGGQVHFQQPVLTIQSERSGRALLESASGASFRADTVVINAPPWNARQLLGEGSPPKLRGLSPLPQGAWGAFTLYAGLDGSIFPQYGALHHQVVLREPLGQGNSVFLSVSPVWDGSRAPDGRRALTMSTHTLLRDWWQASESDRTAYEALKAEYTGKLLDAAEVVLPGVRDAAEPILPGTPVTFHRFTNRERGWVGGFPQTSILRPWGPRLAPGVWMVGDSIFPGQSVAAVALGGLRVAHAIMSEPGSDLRART